MKDLENILKTSSTSSRVHKLKNVKDKDKSEMLDKLVELVIKLKLHKKILIEL